MASNRMSDDQRADIINCVDGLLGRGVPFLKCPLTDIEDAKSIVAARVSDELIEAVRVVIQAKMSLGSMTQFPLPYEDSNGDITRLTIHIPDGKYIVRYPVWDDEKKRKAMKPFTLDEMTLVVRGEFADAFDSWVINAAKFTREATEAYATIDKIVDMAQTPGQLRRMMPDLIQYMPEQLQKILKEKQRASSMPFEWAAFAREPVYRAAETLAKCHLIPKLGDHRWTKRTLSTWIAVD